MIYEHTTIMANCLFKTQSKRCWDARPNWHMAEPPCSICFGDARLIQFPINLSESNHIVECQQISQTHLSKLHLAQTSPTDTLSADRLLPSGFHYKQLSFKWVLMRIQVLLNAVQSICYSLNMMFSGVCLRYFNNTTDVFFRKRGYFEFELDFQLLFPVRFHKTHFFVFDKSKSLTIQLHICILSTISESIKSEPQHIENEHAINAFPIANMDSVGTLNRNNNNIQQWLFVFGFTC